MNEIRPRSAVKSVVAILCAACFLTMTFGTASRAVAAEEWPVWPKKTAEPGVEVKLPPPPQPVGAAKEGRDGGDAVKKGVSGQTIGWIAAGVALAIGIGVAAGGGGGGGSTSGH